MTSSENLFVSYLSELALQWPLWIVYIVGIIFVVARWRSHSRPSNLALWGLILLIFDSLVMSFVSQWIFYNSNQPGWTTSQTRQLVAAAAFVRYAIMAAGIGLLLGAVYSSRLPQAARRAERVRDMEFPFDQPNQPLPETVLVEKRGSVIRERKD